MQTYLTLLNRDTNHNGISIGVVPDGMRDHPLHKIRLILFYDHFFVIKFYSSLTFYYNKKVIVLMSMRFYRTATVFKCI